MIERNDRKEPPTYLSPICITWSVLEYRIFSVLSVPHKNVCYPELYLYFGAKQDQKLLKTHKHKMDEKTNAQKIVRTREKQ